MRREVLEQRQRLVDGQLEHVGDRLAAVLDLERLAVVAPSLALLAGHVDVGQEVHLDRDHAVALARLAAPALHVEREAARLEAARLRLGHHREQIADEREQPGVGGRIRSRRAPDRRLIDLDHLVDELDALDAVVRAGLVAGPVERARERLVEDVVDERGLARPADAGDRRQHAERDPHVDVLQVVLARAADDDLALERRAGGRGGVGIERAPVRYAPVSEARPAARHQLGGRALEDHVAAVLAGARAEVDDVVGDADRLLVVLDDDDRVAEVAQPRQRPEQLAVVALVQADRRLVEHVQHAGEIRADLRREADALPFAARQRRGAAAEREVADADVVQEPQALLDLAQDALGDDRLAIGQLQRVEHVERFRRSAGST